MIGSEFWADLPGLEIGRPISNLSFFGMVKQWKTSNQLKVFWKN